MYIANRSWFLPCCLFVTDLVINWCRKNLKATQIPYSWPLVSNLRSFNMMIFYASSFICMTMMWLPSNMHVFESGAQNIIKSSTIAPLTEIYSQECRLLSTILTFILSVSAGLMCLTRSPLQSQQQLPPHLLSIFFFCFVVFDSPFSSFSLFTKSAATPLYPFSD